MAVLFAKMAIFPTLLLHLLLQAGGSLVQGQSVPASTTTETSEPPATVTSITTSISVSTAPVTSTATTTTTTTDATRVVPVFYLDERAFEGLPYTLLHRVCGNVIGADDTATTFVITTTRVDLRATNSPTRTTGNITTAIPTLKSRTWSYNATGQASTITQGPQTFLFTGTRWGVPNRTIVNRCRLNGTANARCNLTHVGDVWYTHDSNWNGTFSTYSYNWTSGDRYGFAPCTVTSGVEMMGPPTLTSTTSSNGAAPAGGGGRLRGEELRGLICSAGLMAAFIFGLFLVA